MNRKITAIEELWIKEALEQEPDLSDKERERYLNQIGNLVVVEECDCGDPDCGSVKFSSYEEGASLGIADGVVNKSTNDEMRIILFINENNGELSEIETVK